MGRSPLKMMFGAGLLAIVASPGMAHHKSLHECTHLQGIVSSGYMSDECAQYISGKAQISRGKHRGKTWETTFPKIEFSGTEIGWKYKFANNKWIFKSDHWNQSLMSIEYDSQTDMRRYLGSIRETVNSVGFNSEAEENKWKH